MNQYLSQRLKIGDQEISGPLTIPNKTEFTVADVVGRVLEFLYPFSALLLFLYLLWGGYDFLLSGGNPEKIKAGKAKITAALIGFLLLIVSYFVVRLISIIFGLGEGIL